MFAGSDIHGSTLGILGMGRIGQGIARRGAHGFGMKVIYHNRSRLAPELEAQCKARYVGKEELLQTADHLVLVLPYSPASHHTIGAAELALMKPTANLINIARGGIVDDAALAAALREKRIAAAGLDVFEGEPKVHPDLLTVPNVVLTPHIASATVPTRMAMAESRGRQPDRLPGARQAADAAESRSAGQEGCPWKSGLLIALAIANLVLVVHAADAQAAGQRRGAARELLARQRARSSANCAAKSASRRAARAPS